MKTRLAMFDLDGTLFDTRRVNWLSYREALAPFGVDLDYGYFCRECNGKHYKAFVPGLLAAAGNAAETLAEKAEAVHERKKALYGSFLSESVENTQLFNLIHLMKESYYIALVTTASRKNCREILAFHGREGDFDLILTAEDVERKKPDPQGFLMAMEHFNIGGADSLVFEDSAEGLAAAEASGATVFAARGFA
ncbi:MAG: HAD family phosphatase [Treponema sp.]|nr:HAD family phosphatase [Treponema sp.]